ncbi:MAG: hypothetical protein CMH26_08875 [Micavibrio sp.]|nr:hypothetical protein [Micavibrio sp.]
MEKKYLPEELGDEEIVLKPRIAFKFTIRLTILTLISLIPIINEELFNNGKNLPAAILLTILIFIIYSPAFVYRLVNKNQRIHLSKDGIKFLINKEEVLKWDEIYKINPGSKRVIGHHGTYPILISYADFRFKDNTYKRYPINYYDSPHHIAESLEKYSQKYDPNPKKFSTPEIKDKYEKEIENANYTFALMFILIPIAIAALYILTRS